MLVVVVRSVVSTEDTRELSEWVCHSEEEEEEGEEIEEEEEDREVEEEEEGVEETDSRVRYSNRWHGYCNPQIDIVMLPCWIESFCWAMLFQLFYPHNC